nr:MAG TPA: hypothetical protein [Caudoviricetes sp.]
MFIITNIFTLALFAYDLHIKHFALASLGLNIVRSITHR